MLRTIGAQIEKTTNREAMRDLSGRRMRDINNEKKLVWCIFGQVYSIANVMIYNYFVAVHLKPFKLYGKSV